MVATMLEQACLDVSRAIEAGDWDRADRGLQYLAGAMGRAGLESDAVAEVAPMLADLRIRVVTEHDVDQAVGPTQVAWMLAGIGSVVRPGRR